MDAPHAQPRLVASRYTERYSTPDGTFPAQVSLADVFQEDIEAASLVAAYIRSGENPLLEFNPVKRVLSRVRWRRALANEQTEAARLARLARSEGAPLIAALLRQANAQAGPSFASRRARLLQIAHAAQRNEPVPEYSHR